MTRLVCWQPLLTDHQRHTLDALGSELGCVPEYVVATVAHEARDGQGWARVDAAVSVMPPDWSLKWARQWFGDAGTIHIFGSPFGDRRLTAILAIAQRHGARVWLVSEPWSDSAEGYFSPTAMLRDRFKAILRPLLYRLYGRLIRGVAGVFAISPLAVSQYRAIGVPPERVVPFGYFVPGPAVTLPPPAPTACLRVAFVGALIARKGVADLAAAAALLEARGVAMAVDVYGSGTLADTATVRHRGTIPFGDAPRVIAEYDIVVVPSRHDGWGVVVNEALMAGVPVAASDRTGAGAMIDRWGCGVRFAAGDPTALAAALAAVAADRCRLAAMRDAALALAPRLTPACAARYMAAAIGGKPEANPWF